MSRLNLSGFLLRSAVNGPGIRTVVWVQGCPIRCKGCFNTASWSFSPVITISVRELAGRILATEGIDGVTFSGGEPFAQAMPLAEVAEQVREAGLTVVTYSGYTHAELTQSRDPAWKRLFTATDLLIAGPYREDEACTAPFMGSANQQVIPLNERIIPESEILQKSKEETIEFTIAPDGTVTTTGFPTPAIVRQIAARCRGN
ncbi:MAG: 4Fe-4S single cluster domain-containing protein [Methanoregula sp.]